MITIEKGIPLPKDPAKIDRRKIGKYPFGVMDIGDSFFISGEGMGGPAYSAAMRFGLRNDRRFKCVGMDDGLRIWRTG